MAATTSKPKSHRQKRRRASPGDDPVGPRRVAIYLRRSTDDEHQPFSIDAQQTALTNYVASQLGWTLVATYSDDASGATTDRPDLKRALGAARAGRYDVLLVYRVDRFSRRLSDLLDLLNELDEANVAFCSATEPFDTSTSIGRMLVQLLGVFAEFERETIVDRVINGMTTKASKGKWSGGTRPYGYLVARDTQQLIPHPAEAPVLRDIFRLYTQDRIGTRAIAAELNSRGIRNRTGKVWSGHTIARILDNPAYTGDIVYRDVHVTDAHPPLIDRAVFDRAREIATARGDAQTQRALSDSDYHLTGLITCPDCGHKYIGTSANGRTKRYRYYTCFSRTRYGRAGCDAPRLPADDLDPAVLQALYDFYTQTGPLLLTEAIARAQRHFRDSHVDRRTEHDALNAQIAAKRAAVARYHTAFENGTMDDTTAGPRLRELRHEIEQLTAHRDDLAEALDDEPEAPTAGAIERIVRYLHQTLTQGTSAERKAAIESLIAEVRLTSEGVIIPVFKLPTPDAPLPGEAADVEEPPVRTMVRSVELRGLEPLTPTLPVWCATSCATAPCPAEPNGLLKCTQSPRVPVTRYPGASVQGGIGRERGHRRHQPALPAQHHLPQVVRLRHERVARERVQDEPGTLVYLGLQLLGVPPGIAGEDAEAVQFTGERFGVAGEVDGADDAFHPTEAVRIRTGAGAGQADGGLGLHRAALEHHGRLRGQGIPAGQHLADRHLGGAVQHHAEGTGFLVRDQQHHGPLEVRVLQRRRRDEESSRESISRHARDHAQTRGSSGR
jgi:site-specific DNA recombinase